MEAPGNLAWRERQIMDAVYRLGRATVADVRANLPDPPSYSTVRAMLVKLEAKGHLRHRVHRLRYVYEATVPLATASESALGRVVRTFFDDSPAKTVQALLDLKGEDLIEEELDELAELIQRARTKER